MDMTVNVTALLDSYCTLCDIVMLCCVTAGTGQRRGAVKLRI